MKPLTENLDGFGLPQEEAAMDEARVQYKNLLMSLLDAVDLHMQIMAGSAEEGAVDTLSDVVAATKEALAPKEEPAEDGVVPEAPAEEE